MAFSGPAEAQERLVFQRVTDANAFVASGRMVQLGGIQASDCPAAAAAPDIEMAFSPDQGATDLVVKTIGAARSSIRVAAYSFTSGPIADALIAAHARGVDVEIVADGSNRHERGSKIGKVAAGGVPTRLNDRFAIMHDKFIIVDGNTLETGSFNYTGAAECKNAENVIVLHNVPALAQRYENQWRVLWDGGQ